MVYLILSKSSILRNSTTLHCNKIIFYLGKQKFYELLHYIILLCQTDIAAKHLHFHLLWLSRKENLALEKGTKMDFQNSFNTNQDIDTEE